MDKGFLLFSDKDRCVFIDEEGSARAIAKRQSKLYKMDFVPTNKTQLNEIERNLSLSINSIGSMTSNSDATILAECHFVKKIENLSKWHRIFAHQNINQIKLILSKNNIKFIDDGANFVCEQCLSGKQHRMPFPASESRAKERLELVHADVCGPMKDTSLGGARYFLVLKDDYTSYRFVYFLKHKLKVKSCIEKFIAVTERETGCKMKCLRSDNGLELVNKDMDNLLTSHDPEHGQEILG